MNEEILEEILDDDDNYFEPEDWKKLEEWLAYVKKKSLHDYKEFRKYTNIPHEYLKDELEGMEFVESIGFITGFDEVQRYGKTCYQIRQADIGSLKATLSDPYTGWFDKVCFDKQEECCDIRVPELDTEEDFGYSTVEWEEYVHQRTDWEDCYYGFFALPMTDGRFWLLYYKC